MQALVIVHVEGSRDVHFPYNHIPERYAVCMRVLGVAIIKFSDIPSAYGDSHDRCGTT